MAGFDVEIVGQKNGSLDKILIGGRGRIPKRLSIAAANPMSPFRGLRTGDEGFDSRIYVMGPEAETVALLGHDTRRMILDIVSGGGAEIEDGNIRLDKRAAQKVVHGRLAGEVDGKVFARFVARTIELAKRVARWDDDDIAERLAHNVEFDERVGVRRKNLALLTTYFDNSIHARAGARSVLKHFDYNLRLEAAVLLADCEEHELGHLRTLYFLDKAPTDVRLTALQRILVRLEGGDRRMFLRAVLRGRYAQGRHRAIAFCRQHRIQPELHLMHELLAHTEEETVAQACGLIATLAITDLEPALHRPLRNGGHDVRCQAAIALGTVGGRLSVEPLRALASGILVHPDLKQRADDALRFIRSRLLYAPGGLSIADVGGRGAVSLTGETAALSLPPEGGS